MNIECEREALNELEGSFRFNDAIIRHITIRQEEAVTKPSPLLKENKPGDKPEYSKKPYFSKKSELENEIDENDMSDITEE